MGTGSSSELKDPREPNGIEKSDIEYHSKKHRDPRTGIVTHKDARLDANIVVRLGGQNIPFKLHLYQDFPGGATVGDMVQQLMKNHEFKELVFRNVVDNSAAIMQLKSVPLHGKDGRITTVGDAWNRLYEDYKDLLDVSTLRPVHHQIGGRRAVREAP